MQGGSGCRSGRVDVDLGACCVASGCQWGCSGCRSSSMVRCVGECAVARRRRGAASSSNEARAAPTAKACSQRWRHLSLPQHSLPDPPTSLTHPHTRLKVLFLVFPLGVCRCLGRGGGRLRWCLVLVVCVTRPASVWLRVWCWCLCCVGCRCVVFACSSILCMTCAMLAM